jgi:hypothetical protein
MGGNPAAAVEHLDGAHSDPHSDGRLQIGMVADML